MTGQAVSFELKNNPSKGIYEIRMKVRNEINTFDISLKISEDGYCSTSVTGYKIDQVRYSGNFIPFKPKTEEKEEKIDPGNVVI
jgi:hypothetical protein